VKEVFQCLQLFFGKLKGADSWVFRRNRIAATVVALENFAEAADRAIMKIWRRESNVTEAWSSEPTEVSRVTANRSAPFFPVVCQQPIAVKLVVGKQRRAMAFSTSTAEEEREAIALPCCQSCCISPQEAVIRRVPAEDCADECGDCFRCQRRRRFCSKGTMESCSVVGKTSEASGESRRIRPAQVARGQERDEHVLFNGTYGAVPEKGWSIGDVTQWESATPVLVSVNAYAQS